MATGLGFEGGEHGFISPSSQLPRNDFWSTDYLDDPFKTLRMVKYYSPDNFWLHNLGQLDELDIFQEQMTDWYNWYWAEHEDLTRDQVVVDGLYAVFDSKYEVWYRGRVLEMLECEYTMQSLDYGSVTTVAKDDICPLRKADTVFPIQTVKAFAYNETYASERPYNSEEALTFYNFMANGKDLNVIVMDETVDQKWGTPQISVVMATAPFKRYDAFELIAPLLYNLGGSLNFDKFLRFGATAYDEPGHTEITEQEFLNN